MTNYLNHHPVIVLLVVSASVIVALFGSLWIKEVKRRRSEKALMESTVDGILLAKGYENRHRFVDDDTMEYLYLVLGTQSKGGEHLVWALVRVGRESVSVKVQHIALDLLRQNSRAMVRDCTNDLCAALKKRGCEASVEAVKGQPDLTMLGVRE